MHYFRAEGRSDHGLAIPVGNFPGDAISDVCSATLPEEVFELRWANGELLASDGDDTAEACALGACQRH
jgi:hypothetical protein